jgi:peptidoglycan hydrolase-like protein with peptidoglycan-binding domain
VHVKKKLKELDDDEMAPEPLSVGPEGVIASVLIALMSSAILYNVIWRQSELDTRPQGDRQPYVEIIAGEESGEAGPATRVSVKKNLKRNRLTAQIQKELLKLGLFDGPVDGIAGEKTRTAVADYRRSNGLAASGKLDQKLLDHIRLTARLTAISAESEPALALKGDDRIEKVQRGLAALGYRPGSFDGFIGKETREAIRAFERDRGWPETGEVSDPLIAELTDIGAYAEAR